MNQNSSVIQGSQPRNMDNARLLRSLRATLELCFLSTRSCQLAASSFSTQFFLHFIYLFNGSGVGYIHVRTTCRISFLRPPYVCCGSSSSHQVWWQHLYPLSHLAFVYLFKAYNTKRNKTLNINQDRTQFKVPVRKEKLRTLQKCIFLYAYVFQSFIVNHRN